MDMILTSQLRTGSVRELSFKGIPCRTFLQRRLFFDAGGQRFFLARTYGWRCSLMIDSYQRVKILIKFLQVVCPLGRDREFFKMMNHLDVSFLKSIKFYFFEKNYHTTFAEGFFEVADGNANSLIFQLMAEMGSKICIVAENNNALATNICRSAVTDKITVLLVKILYVLSAI